MAKRNLFGGTPAWVVCERAPHDQANLAARLERAICVSKRPHRALKKHHAEARVHDVEVTLWKVTNLRIADLETHVVRASFITLLVGYVEKGIGAIDSEYLAARPYDLRDFKGGFSKPTADVEHLVTVLNIKVGEGDVAVNLTVSGEQVSKSNPLRCQDFVPALDEPEVVVGDLGHSVARSSVFKNTSWIVSSFGPRNISFGGRFR